MDCRTAQLLASFSLAHQSAPHAELDADQAAALEFHLRSCPHCARVIHRERAADQKIARAMRDVPVPAGLKDRILQRLRPVHLPWYRRASWQWGLATAAALLAATSIWPGWSQPSRLELQSLVEFQPTQREQFLAWADLEGVEFAPQGGLNLDLLASYGTRDLLGRRVPALLLFHPGRQASAQVFVLRAGQFRWDELPGLFSGRGVQIEVLADSHRPGRVAYLVFYTTESLEPFREQISRS